MASQKAHDTDTGASLRWQLLHPSDIVQNRTWSMQRRPQALTQADSSPKTPNKIDGTTTTNSPATLKSTQSAPSVLLRRWRAKRSSLFARLKAKCSPFFRRVKNRKRDRRVVRKKSSVNLLKSVANLDQISSRSDSRAMRKTGTKAHEAEDRNFGTIVIRRSQDNNTQPESLIPRFDLENFDPDALTVPTTQSLGWFDSFDFNSEHVEQATRVSPWTRNDMTKSLVMKTSCQSLKMSSPEKQPLTEVSLQGTGNMKNKSIFAIHRQMQSHENSPKSISGLSPHQQPSQSQTDLCVEIPYRVAYSLEAEDALSQNHGSKTKHRACKDSDDSAIASAVEDFMNRLSSTESVVKSVSSPSSSNETSNKAHNLGNRNSVDTSFTSHPILSRRDSAIATKENFTTTSKYSQISSGSNRSLATEQNLSQPSLHLYNMRISQHLRSLSSISGTSSFDLPGGEEPDQQAIPTDVQPYPLGTLDEQNHYRFAESDLNTGRYHSIDPTNIKTNVSNHEAYDQREASITHGQHEDLSRQAYNITDRSEPAISAKRGIEALLGAHKPAILHRKGNSDAQHYDGPADNREHWSRPRQTFNIASNSMGDNYNQAADVWEKALKSYHHRQQEPVRRRSTLLDPLHVPHMISHLSREHEETMRQHRRPTSEGVQPSLPSAPHIELKRINTELSFDQLAAPLPRPLISTARSDTAVSYDRQWSRTQSVLTKTHESNGEHAKNRSTNTESSWNSIPGTCRQQSTIGVPSITITRPESLAQQSYRGRAHSGSTLNAWSRYPSHTRKERTMSAGPSDRVYPRDFAAIHIDVESILDDDNSSVAEREAKRKHARARRTMLKKKLRVDLPAMFRARHMVGFRKGQTGHRTSIDVGGNVEYPELELLPYSLGVFSSTPTTHEAGDEVAALASSSTSFLSEIFTSAKNSSGKLEDQSTSLDPRQDSEASCGAHRRKETHEPAMIFQNESSGRSASTLSSCAPADVADRRFQRGSSSYGSGSQSPSQAQTQADHSLRMKRLTKEGKRTASLISPPMIAAANRAAHRPGALELSYTYQEFLDPWPYQGQAPECAAETGTSHAQSSLPPTPRLNYSGSIPGGVEGWSAEEWGGEATTPHDPSPSRSLSGKDGTAESVGAPRRETSVKVLKAFFEKGDKKETPLSGFRSSKWQTVRRSGSCDIL